MLNSAIIENMRVLALSGGDIPAIVSSLMKPGDKHMTILLVIRYFMAAFHMSLSEVRPLEGAACLGNSAYSDAEINALLLPIIRERIKAT
jgi:hypothetical protein